MMKYRVLVISGFVSFVVHMTVFLLEVKLDPVVEAHDLFTMFGFTNKHMLKSTGIFTVSETSGRWRSIKISAACISAHKFQAILWQRILTSCMSVTHITNPVQFMWCMQPRSKEDYSSPSIFVSAIELKPDVIELAFKLSRIRLG